MNEEELNDEFRKHLNNKHIDKRGIEHLMTADSEEDMNAGEDMTEWFESEPDMDIEEDF